MTRTTRAPRGTDQHCRLPRDLEHRKSSVHLVELQTQEENQ